MEVLQATPETPKPYTPLDCVLLESDVQHVMDSFLEFIELPEPEKERIQFSDESRPRTGWAGYAHKTHQDKKHVFHMTKDLGAAFRTKRYSLPTEARRFISLAEDAYGTIDFVAQQHYASKLESEIPGVKGIHFPKSGYRANHLRFLAYEDASGEMLARPHYDKSTGTIAVAESHGGLRVGFGESDIQEVRRDHGEPLFFHGFGWHQLAEMLGVQAKSRAGWHDVIDTGQRVSETIARWALIHFINPAHIYLDSTTEQTHTPIPWRGLGSLALRSNEEKPFNL